MRMRTCGLSGLLIVAAIATNTQAQTAAGQWTATEVRRITGLKVPESVLADPENGVIYISNIDAPEGKYWMDDGVGHIARYTLEGEVKDALWLASSSSHPVNSPKGMCLCHERLYYTDNARLMRRALDPNAVPEEIPLPAAKMLNDLVSDGVHVYVSDVNLGKIYRVDAMGKVTPIPSPASPNGLTFWKDHMFGVSWDLHEVYELDPAGEKPPLPFGLASHFTNLDGIEALDDGSLLVSDFVGNRVCLISADHKTVTTLAELESPADIGMDRSRGLLYVPSFLKDCVVIFRLAKP